MEQEPELTTDDTHPGDEADDRLRARSLELLDFPAIRERVAHHTTFLPASKLALGLTPTYVAGEVDRLQRETAEGLAFLEETGDVDLHAAEDASSAVDRAGLDRTLTGLELLSVAESLDVQRRARSAVLRVRNTVPLLARIAQGIPELHAVQKRINSSIGRRGEVVDDATPSLGPLRKQVREAYQHAAEALEGVIQSRVGREALQDQVVSIRGDRLVLQVKTELRHRVPGIVHDASNTGATLFIEPFSTVDLCNDWREFALEENRETNRVLRDFSLAIGEVADDIRRGSELTTQLDFILARARYSAQLGGVAAVSSDDGPSGLRLLNARHPLLEDAVPITVSIGPEWSVLVITGPNTGGKTVAMKTMGLLALMHQSGLHIPADEGSSLPLFDGVYADVGDQQSIQQSVSTFGSHMGNVIDILSHATPQSLVLLDELGTSTDPEEGSALAKSILAHLASRGVATIATTHHRTVAAHAEATPGMMNASVDLDPDTLRPTYRLTLGVPGRSYAMSVAAQMGMSEEIMDDARSLLEPQYLRFEDWLGELQNERNQLQTTLQEAEKEKARAEASSKDLQAQLDDLALRREEILHTLRGELVEQYDQVKKKLRRADASLSWGETSGRVSEAEVKETRAEIEGAKSEMTALDKRASEEPRRLERRPLATGDVVDIRGLNIQGTVQSIPTQGGEVEVAVGDVRLRLDAQRLILAQEQEASSPDGADVQYSLGPSLSTLELDIRGSRAEEALMRVEEFLDKALRDGLSSVRIIHGRGTGALRAAVRELLEHHPLAKSFAPEAAEKGSDGATVVELV